MTTRFALLHDSIPTIATTKNFTNTDLGSENGLAGFAMTGSPTVLDTTTADIRSCLGLVSGVVENAIAQAIDDGATTGVHARSLRDFDKIAQCPSGSSWTDVYELGVVAEITDGIQYNGLDTAPAMLSTCGCWNGDGFSSDSQVLSTGTTAQNSAISETGMSFEADALIVICQIANGSSGHAVYSIGFVTKVAGTIKQRCFAWSTEGNQYPTVNLARNYHSDTGGASAFDARCGVLHTSAQNTYRASIECTDINATGFDMTMREGAGATETIFILALKSTDWIFRLVDFDTPTSGTEVVDAGIDLASDGGVIRVFTHLTGTDAAVSDNTCIGCAVNMHDGTLHYTLTTSHEDNVSTWVAKQRHATNLDILDGSGNLDVEGTTAFSSTGWTDTYTNFPATALKNFGLAFGPAAAAGGLTVNMGLVTETDLAQSLSKAKARAIGLVSESDLAQAVSAAKQRAIGLNTEVDLAQAVSKAKAQAIGLTIETDLAQPLVAMHSINIGLVSESEVSQAFSALKQQAIGLLTEANLAQVFSKAKSKAIGLVSEIELAQTFSTAKALAIGIVTETELAQTIGRAKAKVVGLLSETDQVFAFDTVGLTVNMGLVLETDIVQTLDKTKDKAIGLLTETDLAPAVSSAKSTPLGLITEFDIPFTLGTAKLRSIGLIAELDAPLAFAVERGVDIGLLLETDTVFAMSTARALSLGLVSESDIVFSMSSPSIILVTNLVQRDARFQVKLRRDAGFAQTDKRDVRFQVKLRRDGLFTETLKRESKFAQSIKRDAKF